MQKATDRNLTVRLPISLLHRLKEESAAEGVSMNAYLERVLAKALRGSKNDAQRMAMTRLLARAKDGLYKMDRPLTREEAHDRHA
jgi:hypothetical protein